ncbi:MAG: HDIG domain-containing protein [Oscillospiraceae bacterium]|nr:HDIG domain-containing protein [Oscillospiraceae bacterium]
MTHQEIETLFPQFLQIADVSLREKAESAMLLAAERGGWSGDTIGKCPVTLNWIGCTVTWIEHVGDVTDTCIAVFDAQKKYYERNGVRFDRDLVVAGALLHDIGKLTEFAFRDGAVCHSDNYQLLRHPLSGAILAHDAGLPDELVHLIAVHSFEGERSYQTAESAFVRKLDIFTFENSVAGLQKR